MGTLSGGSTTYSDAMHRGEWDRAVALLEERAEGPGLAPEETLVLAQLLAARGESVRARALLEPLESHAQARIAAEALVQDATAVLLEVPPDFMRAEDLLDRALLRAGNDAALRGLVAHCRSRLFWKKGSIERAGRCLQESRALLEEAGDEENLAKVLDSLALLHDHHDATEDAIACYLLSLSKKAQRQDLYGIAVTLGNLGRLYLKMRKPGAALECLRDDLGIATRLGDLKSQTIVRINIGQVLTELGRFDEAVRTLREASVVARAHGWVEQHAYALKDLAWALLANGKEEEARATLQQARALVDGGAGTAYVRGQVLLTHARMLLRGSSPDTAEAVFLEARQIFAALDARRDEAFACHGLAEVAERRKDWAAMRTHVHAGIAHLPTLSGSTTFLFGSMLAKLQAIAPDQPVPKTIGPYRVVKRLGGGEFGDVFLALDHERRSPTGEVAIKRLKFRTEEDEAARRERLVRFERESEALGRVRSPYVVRLLDRGEDGVPFLVLEYLPGGDVRAKLTGGEALAVPAAIAIATGVLKGLSALHAMQLVHRDLKPANILLREDGQPVIADFGLVRVLDAATITLSAALLGTLAYMAPEQVEGESVDARADIYALGGILFQLLTGRLPFSAETSVELIRRIREETPPRVTALRPTLPEALGAFVARCLAKNPDARFGDAQAALDALRDATP